MCSFGLSGGSKALKVFLMAGHENSTLKDEGVAQKLQQEKFAVICLNVEILKEDCFVSQHVSESQLAK